MRSSTIYEYNLQVTKFQCGNLKGCCSRRLASHRRAISWTGVLPPHRPTEPYCTLLHLASGPRTNFVAKIGTSHADRFRPLGPTQAGLSDVTRPEYQLSRVASVSRAYDQFGPECTA